MNRTDKISTKKALLFLLIGLSGLVIYILACVHSPVSWSPDSSKIALLVWPVEDEVEVAAIFTYDLKTGRRVVIDMIEKEGSGLSAPAWSPDGKYIAWYRLEAPSTEDPNSPEPVYELFSEDNNMLPAFVYQAGKELLHDYNGEKIAVVKLIVVDAETKALKGERNLLWVSDDDVGEQLLQYQPIWSPDSKTVFYLRTLDSIGYFSSLDIETGGSRAHVFTDTGFAALSPDGTRVATIVGDTVAVSRVDATACQYFNIRPQLDSEDDVRVVQWSPDSEAILLTSEKAFYMADARTGRISKYVDPTAEEIKYPSLSPAGDKIYYLASYAMDDTEGAKKGFSIRAIGLKDKSVEVLTLLSEIDPEVKEGIGILSVSPDGRWLLVRSMVKNKDGEDISSLIFCEGPKKTIIETDSWLKELITPNIIPTEGPR